jgi:hypothetical protein
MVETVDAKGADCQILRYEAQGLSPHLASSALFFLPIFELKKKVTH